MLTTSQLNREAAATGFRPEILEKVIRLLELLETLRSHPFLKSRIALKGGTALNLFVFDVPRLSVDIDLNYIGSATRKVMLEERPTIEQAVHDVCGRLGIQVRRVPAEHAGGKWRLSYTSAAGASGTLELDMNFMLRSPLWPPAKLASHSVGSFQATDIPVLDVHELAAGKLSALFTRNASRDAFDVRKLLEKDDLLDGSRLRSAFVVYGGTKRRDWRELSIDDVVVDVADVARMLVPTLRADVAPQRNEIGKWARQLGDDCRQLLTALLPLTPNEVEFLERLNDRGRIEPELLTSDRRLQEVVREHSGLRWKALNVRKHFGLELE